MREWLDRVARAARPRVVAACAAGALVMMHIARSGLERQAGIAGGAAEEASGIAEEAGEALSEALSRRDVHAAELEEFKKGLPKLTEERRALYEGGLQLQEEKRLLEKQLEIMTIYLLIDEKSRQVHLMRGEQSLESYAVKDAPAAAYGKETREQPAVTTIVSKERFAHPERPKAEEVDGQLQWEPPQVGTSVRANALGEFVVFTKGPLILHGPPAKPDEHKAFAHQCLNLTLPVAKRLYANTYIGTKVTIKHR